MSEAMNALSAILWGGSHGLAQTGAGRALRDAGAQDYMTELTERWASSLDPLEVAELMRRIAEARAEGAEDSSESSEGAEDSSEGSEGAEDSSEGAEDSSEGAEGSSEGSEGAEGAEGAEGSSEGSEGAEDSSEGAEDSSEGAEGSSEGSEGAEGAEGAEGSSEGSEGAEDSSEGAEDSSESWSAGQGGGAPQILPEIPEIADRDEILDTPEITVADVLSEARDDLLSSDDLREQIAIMRETEVCTELGWDVNDASRALVRAMSALPLRRGSAQPKPLIRHMRGVHTRPTAVPRGQARRSRDMAKLHVVEGRMCIELTPASPSMRIVIDTSGSMAGGMLHNAISLAGAVYLTLSPAERRDVRWFAYNTELTELDTVDVPRLQAGGGTSLKCLQPELDRSRASDRWLIITDGAVPDLKSIEGKLAIIVIGAEHPDPRCIAWSDALYRDRVALERACRKIAKLLR